MPKLKWGLPLTKKARGVEDFHKGFEKFLQNVFKNGVFTRVLKIGTNRGFHKGFCVVNPRLLKYILEKTYSILQELSQLYATFENSIFIWVLMKPY